jgi:GMP synthase (glutamine-hydrolysing)
MKLGILICDQVHDQLQPEFGDYPAMFQGIIEQVNPQIELQFFSAVDRQLPSDIDVCDVYMTSGSRWGVNDDSLWIRELEQFIRRLYDGDKGFVGICFGHQLIATSLGGRVGKSGKGWGVGIYRSGSIIEKSWMSPFKDTLNVVVSHQDQIVELPAQTEVLASNEFCPYSMIQVNDHFLGIQGHPEFSRGYSLALMNSRKDRIPASVITQGTASLSHVADDQLSMGWLLNFLAQTVKS